jgi:hypothetical protein
LPAQDANSAARALSLQDPLAAGRKQAQAASDQKPQHQKQAPHGQEKHGQDAGVRRLGLQDLFDDANRGEQSDRA